MKTYIINTLQKLSTVSRSLDFISTIKESEWIVFNDDKVVSEKLLFVGKGSLFAAVKGQTSELKWRYIKVNKSLIIEDGVHKYLYKIILCTKDIVVLNIDGTSNYSFLINSTSTLNDSSYEDIQWYLIRKCGLDILDENQRKIFLEEKKNEQKKEEAESEIREKELDGCIKKMAILTMLIITIIIIGYSISEYIDYKKKHPTIYTTDVQNQVAVDLGLSVNWATCNIGANRPKEFGNYYGWGEPTGTDVFGFDSESIWKLNERFPSREDGTRPPYSIVNTSKDIVKSNWGGKWRMPTKKEVQELIDNCTIRFYESEGEKFIKVIGPNGNFIIIPSAGFLDGTRGNWILDYNDFAIYLYIGELYFPVSDYEYSENEASYLFIGDRIYEKNNYQKIKEKKIESIERYRMLPVRPVIDK